jgi:exodeoxyribonuclease V alpha subunit
MMRHDVLSSCEDTLALLNVWRGREVIRPLDLAFAKALYEMGKEDQLHIEPLSLLMSAVGSLYLSDGHVCIDLEKLYEKPHLFIQIPPLYRHECPDLSTVLVNTSLQSCVQALARCDSVKQDLETQAPLALKGKRLYLSRFFHYEHFIAQGVIARLPPLDELATADSAGTSVIKASLAALFKGEDLTLSGSQMLACALAARSRFAIITGGPGTGKTTTVVKLLAALQAIAGELSIDVERGTKLRIALAAPTGKAAARLSQSISDSVEKLPFANMPGQVTAQDIPTNVTTLHRLLGTRGNSRAFIYHKGHTLPLDVLVIDEASMVDVSLMASVIGALKPKARLILLGDKDQLASVDAGAVLGQLAQRAHEDNYNKTTCTWLSAVTGLNLTASSHEQGDLLLAQNVAMLKHSFRFDASSGIGQLAKMVNQGRADTALLKRFKQTELVDALYLITDISPKQASGDNKIATKTSNAEFIAHIATGSPEQFYCQGLGRKQGDKEMLPPVAYRAYLNLLEQESRQLDEGSCDELWDALATKVLKSFERFQVLCAMRHGPYGVEALNEQIEKSLISAETLNTTKGFYQGRPVLVTRNDYNLGLKNGDVGIVIKRWVSSTNHGNDSEHKRICVPRIAFLSDTYDGKIRWFSPSRLRAIETVFAMTVHKSQGSEFEHACLVLPETLNPVVTKELVYTAITRAKYWLSIVSPNESILKQAIENPISRESGLML